MTDGFQSGKHSKKKSRNPHSSKAAVPAHTTLQQQITTVERHVVMITGIFTGFKRISEEIYRKVTENLPLHQLRCCCGHAGCLVRHGYYTRKLKTREQTLLLCILRVRCKECGRTHAILPETVVPYSQIPADLQQHMLLYPLGSPEMEELMEENSDISESNVLAVRSRYRKHWKERLASMGRTIQDKIQDLIQRAFQVFHHQFMQIHRGINMDALGIHIT